MFGLMCAAADEGFHIFILLTTDNVILQQQTLQRAQMDLRDCPPLFLFLEENDKSEPVAYRNYEVRIVIVWHSRQESK